MLRIAEWWNSRPRAFDKRNEVFCLSSAQVAKDNQVERDSDSFDDVHFVLFGQWLVVRDFHPPS